VQILPFIEQNNLFQQFHLDEPWDSEHNKTLISQMPLIYAKPNRPNDGKTPFQVPVGKGLAFEGAQGLRLPDFSDGTSNTILLVEVNDDRAVEWTKPDDLDVDLSKPLDGLGDAEPNGFAVLLADGSARTLSKSIDPAVLKALFTRAGGEPINPNDIEGSEIKRIEKTRERPDGGKTIEGGEKILEKRTDRNSTDPNARP
jgi:hypothetical protein